LRQTAFDAIATAPHAVHPPQCAGSLRGSTHAPLHTVSGGAHVAPHVPLLHTWPAPHAVPELPASAPHPAVAPQCALLVFGSTHAPPQSTSLPGHELAHTPAAHT
jgi:hypothetical protein